MDNSTQVTMDRIGHAEGLVGTSDKKQPTEGVTFYHGRMLDELPGAASAAITVVWLVSSFAGLMW